MREGRVVGTVEASRTNLQELSAMMVGKSLTHRIRDLQLGKTVLQVDRIQTLSDRKLALKDVTFSVHECEIFGYQTLKETDRWI